MINEFNDKAEVVDDLEFDEKYKISLNHNNKYGITGVKCNK